MLERNESLAPQEQIVEMPHPQYITVPGSNGREIRLIGIYGVTLTHNIIPMLWVDNVTFDLTVPRHRKVVAAKIARIWLAYGINAAAGPGVILARSDYRTGVVATEPACTGIYAERSGDLRREQLKTMRKMREFEQLDREATDRCFRAALEVLPK